jgi:hypothetical protein
MGTATGTILYAVRATHRSATYFGPCEVCGQHVSDCFVGQARREYRRADGTLYHAPIGGGRYGHEACVASPVGQPTQPGVAAA